MKGTAPESDARDPRLALSLFYAAQFGHMGIVLPFLAPWIERQGFGALGIGVLMALPPLFKIVAPWTWGPWADRSGRRRELLVAACAGAAVGLAGLSFAGGTAAIALLLTFYAFNLAPTLPYVEATTLEQSEHRRFDYGPIRLWGSLGFMGVSAAYGAARGSLPQDAGLWLAAGLLLVAAVPAGFAFPRPLDRRDPPETGTGGTDGSGPADGRVGLVRFFACCALMQVSHGAYYTFYSIRLQNLGYGGGAIGALWAFGVLCEILLLTRMDRIVDRYGTVAVMTVSLLIAAGRWVLIGSVDDLLWLALAQTAHAVTYAAFHVAAIREVYRRFGSAARARGQAMYSGMTYGLGMFLGSLGAGWLGAALGIPALFQVSAGVALIAIPVLGRPSRTVVNSDS